MNYIKVLGTMVCILCLGQASARYAQAQANSAGSNPIVSVSTGQLRGSLSADGVAVFKNIPFAQPPVGDLRWQEPSPAKVWTGVREATAFGSMCHQNDNKQLPHSEDCLQLNAWTPKWRKFDGSKRSYIDFTDAGPVVKEGLRRQVCDVFMENQKRLAAQ